MATDFIFNLLKYRIAIGTMTNNIVTKLSSIAFGRRLRPLSISEGVFLADLQAVFRAFPTLDTSSGLLSELAWIHNTNRLKELVLESKS